MELIQEKIENITYQKDEKGNYILSAKMLFDWYNWLKSNNSKTNIIWWQDFVTYNYDFEVFLNGEFGKGTLFLKEDLDIEKYIYFAAHTIVLDERIIYFDKTNGNINIYGFNYDNYNKNIDNTYEVEYWKRNENIKKDKTQQYWNKYKTLYENKNIEVLYASSHSMLVRNHLNLTEESCV